MLIVLSVKLLFLLNLYIFVWMFFLFVCYFLLCEMWETNKDLETYARTHAHEYISQNHYAADSNAYGTIYLIREIYWNQHYHIICLQDYCWTKIFNSWPGLLCGLFAKFHPYLWHISGKQLYIDRTKSMRLVLSFIVINIPEEIWALARCHLPTNSPSP